MIKWILPLALIVLTLAFILYHIHMRKMIAKIDHSLDLAIAGTLDIKEFSETQTSKLDAKLVRYLTSAKLRQSDLSQAQSKTRALISDISHQTKTPLSNILLNAQLLAEQPELSAGSRELVMQLEKSSEKLSFLIQSLVKISRLESGTIQVTATKQSLSDLVRSSMELCQADAAAKEISISFSTPQTDIFALCDVKWCIEAVCNLIDNAVKYTPEKGEIKISLFEYQLFSCIEIRDNGKGILPADLPKIFGRFYRAVDSAAAPGVGLGLYLAREIVQQCGGYIQVTSVPGEGSVFAVYLSKP